MWSEQHFIFYYKRNIVTHVQDNNCNLIILQKGDNTCEQGNKQGMVGMSKTKTDE